MHRYSISKMDQKLTFIFKNILIYINYVYNNLWILYQITTIEIKNFNEEKISYNKRIIKERYG